MTGWNLPYPYAGDGPGAPEKPEVAAPAPGPMAP